MLRLGQQKQRKYIERLILNFCVLVLPLAAGSLNAQDAPRSGLRRASVSNKATTGDRELARLRADLLEKMKESRASTEKLLALHEEQKNKVSEEYQRRRVLYDQGLISRAELNQAERALAGMILRVDEDKRWLTESDIAITEASLRDELLRLPGLAVGGYSESATLMRFNGRAAWSLTDAPKIEKFFSQAFGHGLPISAFGQTATHDRLRFDHRNAMDVALSPDSDEGRSLLSYLRQAGIPFIAFRHAVPGAATGAHIHIGNPSNRN
jgi:acetyl esterase/lipase